MNFFKNLIKELIDEDNIVDLAANNNIKPFPDFYNDLSCKKYSLSCERTPFSLGTINAYKEIKNLIEENDYDIVHCHTPIAALCTRLACRKQRKKGLRVIYTAHGFHFYKGAPLLNWLIYYPIEKICSYFTDVLITINKEDYELAKKKMKAKHVEYVPGVGIDVDKFKNTVVDKAEKRKELGIPEDAFLLVSVGELNKNKNHEVVIRALAEINNPDIHYAIAGVGPLHDYLLYLAKELNLEDRVHLLGYRTDVAEIYKCANLYILPSIREGLNVSIMEGIASGLPVLCGNIRGNIDLVLNENLLFSSRNRDSVEKVLNYCFNCFSEINEKDSFIDVEQVRECNILKLLYNIYFKKDVREN